MKKVVIALLCTFFIFAIFLMSFPSLVGSSNTRSLDDLPSVDVVSVYSSFVGVINSIGSTGRTVINDFVMRPISTLGIIFAGPQSGESTKDWFMRAWHNFFYEYNDMEIIPNHSGGGFSF